MPTDANHNNTASFGFRDVPAAEKEKLVHGVFSSVAKNYDLMNDLMSLGVHRLWKDAMVAWLNPQPGWTCLDVAGGTGDIAFRIAKAIRRRHPEVWAQRASKDGVDITVCDINPDMLAEGVKRAGGDEAIAWVAGDAQSLPLPDNAFDSYTIAFGIRNVTRIEKALEEAQRVLKPGGRFLCLEFSRPTTDALRKGYDLYSFKVIPQVGEWVAGDRDAYQYLVESIRRFPDQKTLAKLMAGAGFGRVSFTNFTGGVVALHQGWAI